MWKACIEAGESGSGDWLVYGAPASWEVSRVVVRRVLERAFRLASFDYGPFKLHALGLLGSDASMQGVWGRQYADIHDSPHIYP